MKISFQRVLDKGLLRVPNGIRIFGLVEIADRAGIEFDTLSDISVWAGNVRVILVMYLKSSSNVLIITHHVLKLFSLILFYCKKITLVWQF